MDYKKIYEEWISNPYFDEDTKKELNAIKDDDKEMDELDEVLYVIGIRVDGTKYRAPRA